MRQFKIQIILIVNLWFESVQGQNSHMAKGAEVDMFEQTPYFLWKRAIYDASDGFMGNVL